MRGHAYRIDDFVNYAKGGYTNIFVIHLEVSFTIVVPDVISSTVYFKTTWYYLMLLSTFNLS